MMRFVGTAITAVALVSLASIASAEVTVKLEGVHICCGACVKGINAAAGTAKVDVDKDGASVTIHAADNAAAQKVVDALAAAGYHGESDSKEVTMKNDSGAPSGKVTKLTVTGIHNCCGGCAKAIVSAVKDVEGVQAPDLKGKVTTFTVEGNFDAAKLIEALYDAGFHAKVAK
jgi:copper chaperone CopZ